MDSLLFLSLLIGSSAALDRGFFIFTLPVVLFITLIRVSIICFLGHQNVVLKKLIIINLLAYSKVESKLWVVLEVFGFDHVWVNKPPPFLSEYHVSNVLEHNFVVSNQFVLYFFLNFFDKRLHVNSSFTLFRDCILIVLSFVCREKFLKLVIVLIKELFNMFF